MNTSFSILMQKTIEPSQVRQTDWHGKQLVLLSITDGESALFLGDSLICHSYTTENSPYEVGCHLASRFDMPLKIVTIERPETKKISWGELYESYKVNLSEPAMSHGDMVKLSLIGLSALVLVAYATLINLR